MIPFLQCVKAQLLNYLDPTEKSVLIKMQCSSFCSSSHAYELQFSYSAMDIMDNNEHFNSKHSRYWIQSNGSFLVFFLR